MSGDFQQPGLVNLETGDTFEEIKERDRSEEDISIYERRITAEREGRRRADEKDRAQRQVQSTPLSKTPLLNTKWLWENRIPLGEISLLVGKAGVGKSLLLCTHTAWITTGKMRGEFFGTPRDVIYVANEDSYEKAVAPRMFLAGADLDRVHRLSIYNGVDAESTLILPEDCERLANVCKAEGAVTVFLDPLSSNMSDPNRNSPEVRRSYERLAKFAEVNNIAVVGNAHMRKGQSADMLEAIMGSSEIGNVVRAAMGVMKDPDSEENQMILSQVKNNYGPGLLRSYTYTVPETTKVHMEHGLVKGPIVKWGASTERNVQDLMTEGITPDGSRTDIAEATEWLRSFLSMNPAHQRQKVEAEANKAGVKPHTLKRAARRLRVVSEMHGYPRIAHWSLPSSQD